VETETGKIRLVSPSFVIKFSLVPIVKKNNRNAYHGGPDYNQQCRALRTTAAKVCTMKTPVKSSLTEKAMQAMNDAVAKVVEDHRRRGRPLAVWRQGKAVWISAAETGALRENPPHAQGS
jgi:hypothetical protein